MSTVRLFHDFSSPFSYLASTQIESLCQRCSAQLVWHPMLLGALFKAVGTPNVPLLDMPPAKQQFARLDMQRFADYYGVPLRFPSRFPMRTVEALRLVIAAEQHASAASAVSMTHRLYRAYWAEDRDLADREVLIALCGDCGLDPALVDQSSAPEIKQSLFSNTEAAVDAGVFGAPTFVIDDRDLIWGQDRLPLVEWMLRREAPADA